MRNKINSKKTAILIIIVHLVLYNGWLVWFKGNDEMLKLGGNAFQLLAPVISGFWLFKESYHRQGRERLFWFLIGMGNMFYFLAQLIWNYYEWILHKDAPAVGIADIVWCFQYVAYLAGMLLKMLQLSNQRKTFKLLFDIIIVMVVATTFSWQFIIHPILSAYIGTDWWATFIYIFYPVGDLGLLFGALTIIYAAEKTASRSLSVGFSLGILALIIGDTYYSFSASAGHYHTGNFIDPVWSLSLFLIGIAAVYHEQPDYKMLLKIKRIEHIHIAPAKKSMIDYTYFILPYAAVIILFCQMLTQVQMDAIFVGLCISVGLLFIRQILTLLENEDLLRKYKTLTDELDEKVKERTKELEHLAYHDQLTGLPNRRYFESYLKDSIAKSKINHQTFAVLLLDLDRFKQINDVMGHSMGDFLLIKMAERLALCINGIGKVFRLGGDEFTIILPDSGEKEAELIAKRTNNAVNRTLMLGDEEVKISTSIGISMFPCNGDNSDTLLKQADVAMYEAKENGKNNFRFFTNEMKYRMSKQITIEYGLRTAIEDQSLHLVYQPIINTQTDEIFGAEALLRWKHPTLGPVPPVEFIPVAEETGLIIEIGYWVIKTACLEAKRWHKEGYPLEISINISVTQFKQTDFVNKVKSIFHEVGLVTQFIHFEITESVAVLDAEMVVSRLKELRELGIQISIDDFGTGYSSLNYLNKFPLSTLKIDKSFIDHIEINPQDKQIVSTIINLADNLKANVIAEGVETKEQVATLKSFGCYFAQGYLFSRPLNGQEFDSFISSSKKKELISK